MTLSKTEKEKIREALPILKELISVWNPFLASRFAKGSLLDFLDFLKKEIK